MLRPIAHNLLGEVGYVELTNTKAGEIYETIRGTIIQGEFRPGERLSEDRLMARTEASSRTPVREALRQLAAEGLVDYEPNRGARVPLWSGEELAEIYDLRTVLEGHGAALAAKHAERLDFDLLRELDQRMWALADRVSPDVDQIARINVRFHDACLSAASSQRVVSALSALAHVPLVYQVFHAYDSVALRRSLSDHSEFLLACEARDPVWARAIMEAHLRGGYAALTRHRPSSSDSE